MECITIDDNHNKNVFSGGQAMNNFYQNIFAYKTQRVQNHIIYDDGSHSNILGCNLVNWHKTPMLPVAKAFFTTNIFTDIIYI